MRQGTNNAILASSGDPAPAGVFVLLTAALNCACVATVDEGTYGRTCIIVFLSAFTNSPLPCTFATSSSLLQC